MWEPASLAWALCAPRLRHRQSSPIPVVQFKTSYHAPFPLLHVEESDERYRFIVEYLGGEAQVDREAVQEPKEVQAGLERDVGGLGEDEEPEGFFYGTQHGSPQSGHLSRPITLAPAPH